MFGLTRRLRVFAYAAPVDMRKSFYTLAGLVTESGHEITAGDVFLFVAKGRRRAKVLWFDGTGLVLLAKVLEKGLFAPIWERTNNGTPVELTITELAVFLEANQDVSRGSIVLPTFSFDTPPTQI